MQITTTQGFGTVVTGSADEIMDILRGPRAIQHDEHCKGYQWELYLQDARKRAAAVDEAVRQLIANRNAARDAREFQQAAE